MIQEHYDNYATAALELQKRFNIALSKTTNDRQEKLLKRDFDIKLLDLKEQFCNSVRRDEPDAVYKFSFSDIVTCKIARLWEGHNEILQFGIDRHNPPTEKLPIPIEPSDKLIRLILQERGLMVQLLQLQSAILQEKMVLCSKAAEMEDEGIHRRKRQSQRNNFLALLKGKKRKIVQLQNASRESLLKSQRVS